MKPPITLATLPQATAQEVFDQVAIHLLTQNATSVNNGSDKCLYRSEVGKCAAGCLIGDDEYHPDMDSGGSSTWYGLSTRGLVPPGHLALIVSLQSCHDCYIPNDWKGRLESIAESFSLKMPTIS